MVLPTLPQPSLQAVSSDILGKTRISAGVSYNINQNTGGTFLSISYGGIYPVISAGIGYTGMSSKKENSNETHYDYWSERNANVGISLPFDFSRGIYSTGVQIGATAELVQTVGSINTGENGRFVPIRYYFNFINTRHYTERDIYPVWSQMLDISFINTPIKSEFHATKAETNLQLNFPGIVRHHSLQLKGNYCWQVSSSRYTFGINFLFPRGYIYETHNNLYSFSADYTFPIYYPDVALGQWIYFKRVRGNLFFDYGEGKNEYFKFEKNYKSFGGDLSFDFNLFSWPFLLNLGGRLSYLLKEQKEKYDVVFNFGL